MERFQGHNKQLCSKVSLRSLEVQGFAEEQSFVLEEDTIPFLQMLQQTGDTSLSYKEPNFLALLSLQTLEKPWELESYLSHEVPDFHSPIQSQTNQFYQNQASTTSMERVNETISSQELLLNPLDDILNQTNLIPVSTSPSTANSRRKRKMNHLKPEMSREKRKRKRTKPTKNIEEIENQRMTHIAVERNRRRQMNDHLNSLRTLIPPSYIQRGDQASIVGGAIDFVKVLEQLLQSLEAQKIIQQNGGDEDEQEKEQENKDENPESKSLRDISSNDLRAIKEEQSCTPKIDATVIQNHVNLTIQCHRKQGQLLKAIILLDELRLTVLHLNITSPSHTSISYSFNLKIEEDCNLGSGDEIAAAMSEIFEDRVTD